MNSIEKENNSNNSTQYSICVQNISVVFGTHKILHGLSLNIPKNSITTILGPSGSGKSTLIKHLLGLLNPVEGSVVVLGQEMAKLDRFELREFRKKFGVLFQYAALFDSFTAFDNVAFPLHEFTKLNDFEIEKKVVDLLSSVGIGSESLGKYPSELSGGMRKRVGLARALALDPEIILYDEPTTGLDPVTTKMVNDLIMQTQRRHHSKGITSVIISHDVRATIRISDYIGFLQHGKIVEFKTAAEFAKSQNPSVREFIDL